MIFSREQAFSFAEKRNYEKKSASKWYVLRKDFSWHWKENSTNDYFFIGSLFSIIFGTVILAFFLPKEEIFYLIGSIPLSIILGVFGFSSGENGPWIIWAGFIYIGNFIIWVFVDNCGFAVFSNNYIELNIGFYKFKVILIAILTLNFGIAIFNVFSITRMILKNHNIDRRLRRLH